MVSAAKVGQMYEEPFINLARSFLNHVIRMDYETGHSMLLKDQPDLLLPKIRGVLLKDMKESVVLRCSHRDLKHSSNKVRLRSATTSGLGIQVAHVGHRHVVREIEFVVPIQVPVEHARAIADGFELLAIVIDSLHTI